MIYISLGYATFLLVCENGKIKDAPPIAKWTIGKDVGYIVDYFMKRNAYIEHL